MKKIAAGIGTGCLFLSIVTTVAAEPVPYKKAEGTVIEKIPPHPVAPITAVFDASGRSFPAGRMSFSLNYLFSKTDNIRFQGGETSLNKEVTKNQGTIKLRYGIAPGIDIRSETPLYLITEKDEADDDKTLHFMGDTTIVVHKVVISQTQGAAFDLSFDLGVTLPTAEVSDDSFDFYGTGNWGLLAGVGATWFYGKHRFDGEINFASFKEGKHNYRKPDRCRVNLAWGYIFTPEIDFGIESNYEWNGESERKEKKQGDSFTEWFIGPKFTYRLPQYNVLLGTVLTFPAYRYYDTPSSAEDYRFELKFAKFF